MSEHKSAAKKATVRVLLAATAAKSGRRSKSDRFSALEAAERRAHSTTDAESYSWSQGGDRTTVNALTGILNTATATERERHCHDVLACPSSHLVRIAFPLVQLETVEHHAHASPRLERQLTATINDISDAQR